MHKRLSRMPGFMAERSLRASGGFAASAEFRAVSSRDIVQPQTWIDRNCFTRCLEYWGDWDHADHCATICVRGLEM
jgi:hypothetical protein